LIAAVSLPGLAIPDELTLETAPPVVLKTIPAAGSADVDPGLTEIQVTFSKPMRDGSWSWCNLGEESFPESAGKIHYLPDGRTCVMPVKLAPGRFYATWLNTERFRNFKDRDGQPAVPYLLTFHTTGAEIGSEIRREAPVELRPVPPPITTATADQAFDQLWKAFDTDYAMFVLRPEVNWSKLRDEYRPRAVAAKSAPELANVCADMLKQLRDLHIWMTVAGANVPVFNRPRSSNSNPSAHRVILGNLQNTGPNVKWAVTPDKIGYLGISAWNNDQVPRQCQQALEEMRGTRGLIVDVRLNGGGSEDLARIVAGRFLTNSFIYSFSQFRNGPSHTNLTEKLARAVEPCGPWRYNRPVVLLIGQKCMSSNESFVGMMTGDPDLTTMGDHTCGSSGNPRMVQLPLDITVSVPRWIDYLPDGTPLDERGFQPQIQFTPEPGAFEGDRDDLLKAALERLRKLPLPEKSIEGPRFTSN
jgi:RNA polymerase sigma-70 factor (ECF subfamily)